MTLRVRDTATARTAVEVRFRDGNGVTKPVERLYVRTEAGTGIFYQRGIRLNVSPTEAYGYSSAKAGPVYTNTVAVSVTGGSAPYTHSWVTTGGFSATAASSSSTAFVGNPSSFSGEIDGVATDYVTDANGLTSSISVDVTIVREN